MKGNPMQRNFGISPLKHPHSPKEGKIGHDKNAHNTDTGKSVAEGGVALKGNPNYVYLIGADKLSTELHNISEAMNNKYTNVALDYKYNDEKDPNRYYYRSDHYNFAKNNIPVIFYFNGTHDDYHQPPDTPDKINYEMLENRTRLVFHTAWELANRENRVVVDKGETTK